MFELDIRQYNETFAKLVFVADKILAVCERGECKTLYFEALPNFTKKIKIYYSWYFGGEETIEKMDAPLKLFTSDDSAWLDEEIENFRKDKEDAEALNFEKEKKIYQDKEKIKRGMQYEELKKEFENE